MPCPCGSLKDYNVCCGPYHTGAKHPPTAELLMRSRYSAFVKQEIDYLVETTWPARRKPSDWAGYNERSEKSIWLGLAIHSSENGTEVDARGTVTFTARFMANGAVQEQKEESLFRKKNGHWYYVKAVE